MKNTLSILFALVLLSLASQVSALKSDRDQPADIEADDIEFDFKKGTRTYLNNVLAVQGTLRLKADKLIAIYTDGELSTATAWGSLARFKQRPDGKPNDVEGWAKKIIVDQTANTLTLVGKAALKQGGDTARGDTIVYNMANDTLNVRGGAKVGGGGKPGAVKPKRTIEDPFADDAQGPAEPQSAASAKSSSSDADKTTTASQPAPTRSGRSRLIIQPKPLPESERKKNKKKKKKNKKKKGEKSDEQDGEESEVENEQESDTESKSEE